LLQLLLLLLLLLVMLSLLLMLQQLQQHRLESNANIKMVILFFRSVSGTPLGCPGFY